MPKETNSFSSFKQSALALIEALELENQRLDALRSQSSLSLLGDYGDAIREARKGQGLTMKDLALLSSVSYSTIVKIEANDTGVRLENLLAVSNALGLRLWIG